MSIRARSGAGAALFCAGVLAAVGAGVLGLKAVVWAGLVGAAAGAAVVCWALRDALREIGAAREKYDSLLRAELMERRAEPRDPV